MATAYRFLACLLLAATLHAAPRNLVPDASFESPLPPWFIANQKQYYIGKYRTPDAYHGEQVMVLSGWPGDGATITSPVMHTASETVSLSARIRHRGPADELRVELLLCDESGTVIKSAGKWQADGRNTWHSFSLEDITVSDQFGSLVDGLDGLTEKADIVTDAIAPKETDSVNRGDMKLRLHLRISGPRNGHTLELDSVGVVEGGTLIDIGDNAELIVTRAEDFGASSAWTLERREEAYDGGPADAQLLSRKPGRVATALPIARHGLYRIWVKFRGKQSNQVHDDFRLVIGDQVYPMAQIEYADTKKNYWYFSHVDAELPVGEHALVLEALKPGVRIDSLITTNNPDYVPQLNDFQTTPLYVRYINRSPDQDPFLLYLYIRTHNIADPHQHIGMYCMSGAYGPLAPRETELFVGPGETTPWLKISDYLFADQWTRVNSFQISFTRRHRLNGYVAGRISGEFQFSTMPGTEPIKTVTLDQASAFLTLTLPFDVGRHPGEIRAPMDYVQEKLDFLQTFPAWEGPRLKHLQVIMSNPGFSSNARPVIDGEMQVLQAIGANSIRYLPTSDEAIAYYREHGLLSRYTVAMHSAWALALQENSMYHPDLDELAKHFADKRRETGEQTPYLDRIMLADEPGGMTNADLMNSWKCQQDFKKYLQAQKVTSALDQEFNELMETQATWELFDPEAEPQRKFADPKLYYHMEMYRLQAMPHLMREQTAMKNRHFPESVPTTVNHVPYHNYYGSWVKRGEDPFYAHGPGALEMAWTEDWMAAGAGPMEMASQYALLRGATRHSGARLGGYVVVKDRGGPELARMKLYTALAGGLRTIDLYDYSPPYAGGASSWSEQYDRYPYVQQTLQDFAAIDADLHETTRYPTKIAILYNRTEAIWANPTYTSEYDNEIIHWALAHAGYDAEYISEDQVVAGELERYAVLYMEGQHLRTDAMTGIADWVRAGGVVVGLTGAGQLNEYHEPSAVSRDLFGAVGQEVQDTGVSYPRLGMKKMKPLGRITTEDAAFDIFSYAETIKVDSATPILRTDEGQVIGTVNTVGAGKAYRVGAALGVAYLCSAVRDPAFDPNSFLPTAFDPAIRELIVMPARAAGLPRVVASDEPILTVARYEKPGRTILIVIDHDVRAKESVTLRVPNSGRVSAVRSATGVDVVFAQDGEDCTITLPIEMAEIVVLETAD